MLGGGGAALAGRYFWDRRAAKRVDAEELEQIRRLADEDVTLLGEELSRLGRTGATAGLWTPTPGSTISAALDAYESAQRSVAGIKSKADAISTVTDTLATGRYAIVCVRARVAGEQVPERRVPCFFNPQHGPSTTDVVWNQTAHGTRKVPACAQDAARLKAGEEPEVRYVRYSGRRVPYWEAGAAVAPYGTGYFASGVGRHLHRDGLVRESDRRDGGGATGTQTPGPVAPATSAVAVTSEAGMVVVAETAEPASDGCGRDRLVGLGDQSRLRPGAACTPWCRPVW